MSMTKTDMLAELRDLESKLYSQAVVAKVKKESEEEQMSFAAARLHLTTVISKLNATLMREIREQLAEHQDELVEGIEQLEGSLAKLQGASQWAEAINNVVGVLSRLVPLL